jgi:alcohol dehydrogenase class IV
VAAAWPTDVSEFRPQESLKAVIAGVGSVRARLAGVLSHHSVKRPMIVCGSNLAKSPLLDIVRTATECDAFVYDGCRPHTPVDAVNAGAAAARDGGADAFIALGGSSAVDCGKGIARLVASDTKDVADLEPADFGRLGASPATTGVSPFPFVSITTTLSFAEFMPFWGARHAAINRKLPYLDAGSVTRTIFLDGEMAADTPDGVWLQTGIKGLDDAMSAFCRGNQPEPFLDPVLTEAIAALDQWLPASRGPGQADARQQVLTATWMTKMALPRLGRPTVPAWFSTAARHSLGGVYELPHGIGSCVSLGPGLRFHGRQTGERQALLAESLGWSHSDGDAPLGPGLDNLLQRLEVPTHLSQLGIDSTEFDKVVANIINESPSLGSPAEIRAVCEQLL